MEEDNAMCESGIGNLSLEFHLLEDSFISRPSVAKGSSINTAVTDSLGHLLSHPLSKKGFKSV